MTRVQLLTTSGVQAIPAWEPSTAYLVGDQRIYEQILYVAKESHTSGSTFDVAKWSKLGSAGGAAVTEVNGKAGAVSLTYTDVNADKSGLAATEASRAEAAEALLAAHVAPTGGTTGQALVKTSNTNYDMKWSTIGGGGGGLTQAEIEAFAVTKDQLVYNVKDHGCKMDGRIVKDAKITTGTNKLTSATAAFVAGDKGKFVNIVGAGPAKNKPPKIGTPTNFSAEITTVNSATEVTLSANAGATVNPAEECLIVTDDSKALQELINNVTPGSSNGTGPNTYGTGGIIYFPPGHTMLKYIIPRAGITFKGAGWTSVLHAKYGFLFQMFNLARNDATTTSKSSPATKGDFVSNNMVWEDLRFVGDYKQNEEGSGGAIRVSPKEAAENTRVHRCFFEKWFDYAVLLENNTNVTITENTAVECCVDENNVNVFNVVTDEIGEEAAESPVGSNLKNHDIVIANNRIYKTETAAIALKCSAYIGEIPLRATITGNVIYEAKWTGIGVEINDCVQDVTITGNVVIGAAIGITVDESSGAQIDVAGHFKNITITGNTVDCEEHARTEASIGTTYGIQCSASGAVIAGNSIRGANPIVVQASEIGARVMNVTVSGNNCVVCYAPTAEKTRAILLNYVDNVTVVGNNCVVESETWIGDVTGNTGGTFKLTVTESTLEKGVYVTGAINWNADNNTLNNALKNAVSTPKKDSVFSMVRKNRKAQNLSLNPFAIQFNDRMGSRPITVAISTNSLTGGGSATLTRSVRGAISEDLIFIVQCRGVTVSSNLIVGAGRRGIYMENTRDVVIQGNTIFDCNANPGEEKEGAGIGIGSGEAGGFFQVRDNTIIDRRATPKMQHGIWANAMGGPKVYEQGNVIEGFVKGRTNGGSTELLGTSENKGLGVWGHAPPAAQHAEISVPSVFAAGTNGFASSAEAKAIRDKLAAVVELLKECGLTL